MRCDRCLDGPEMTAVKVEQMKLFPEPSAFYTLYVCPRCWGGRHG